MSSDDHHDQAHAGNTPSGIPHPSSAHEPSPSRNEHDALASSLAPLLRQACQDRLSEIRWFRSAWQAGGASTGYATFRDGSGVLIDVVVKLPVGPSEYRWTASAGDSNAPGGCTTTPRVLASGTELGGYDLAWLVIEKLAGKPLKADLNAQSVDDLLRTAVQWYAQADRIRPIGDDPPKREAWGPLLAKARELVKSASVPEEQRWNEALKHAQRALPTLVDRWESRPINTWCHGDLHPGNAMRREGTPPHPPHPAGTACVLIDLAMVHPGHWVEDAVYLERLYWAKPELLGGVKPVSCVAKHLREMGRLGSEDYTTLAHTRRALMAASVPAFLTHEGHPKHLHAALEVLERSLAQIGR